jgi:hypothetical protein
MPTPKLTPRQTRAINALLGGPVMREGLDRAAGCSNGPQLVRDLIDKGLDIICTLIESRDRDGRPCKPGRYELTDKGRATLQQWGFDMGSECRYG